MRLPEHINDLLQAYFEGDTSPETCAAIEDWLKEDPSNLRLFAEYGCIEDMLFSEQQSLDSEAVYAMMAEEQASAKPAWYDIFEQPKVEATQPEHSLSTREVFSLAGYLLGKALTSKPAIKVYATAAVVLLAVTLLFVFQSEDDTAPNTASHQQHSTDNKVDTPEPLPSSIVATLTNERDAVWDRRPSEEFYAGQRFTLKQGFAEITTARGAVVLLEAPATVELVDSPNTIRSHAGKLIPGRICKPFHGNHPPLDDLHQRVREAR